MKIICIPKTYNLCFTLDFCVQYEQLSNTFILLHVGSHNHPQTKLTLKRQFNLKHLQLLFQEQDRCSNSMDTGSCGLQVNNTWC